ncbi:MAG: restriction endonuclease [Chloroherpetonaceae bacterium]
MARFAKRTDSNHREIANALRALGFKVKNTSHGGDASLDMIVMKGETSYFVEVKTEKGKLRQKQAEFIINNENAVVVRSVDDCKTLLNCPHLLREKSVAEARKALK